MSLTDVMAASRNFPFRPAVKTYTTAFLLNKGYSCDHLRRNFESFRAIIQEKSLALVIKEADSLLGTRVYNALGILTVTDFLNRLMLKRAVYFSSRRDSAGIVVETPHGLSTEKLSDQWVTVGSINERPPFTLHNCLSYDELRFSALITFSSESAFLNDGRRKNRGYFEPNRARIQDHGVIIGGIGPRMERWRAMEHRDLFVPRWRAMEHLDLFVPGGHSNTSPTDRIFRDYYGSIPCEFADIPLYQHATEDIYTLHRSLSVPGSHSVGTFKQCAYRDRLALSFDSLLIDTNDRAKRKEKFAVLHVTGLGLGVWKLFLEQTDIYVTFFLERVQALQPKMHHIRRICMNHLPGGTSKHIRRIGRIGISFEDVAPALRLAPDEMLAYVFAGNSNAHGGNGFWKRDLDGSAEPAAAAFSQIAETFNPYINPRVRVESLYVATEEATLVPIAEYLRTMPGH